MVSRSNKIFSKLAHIAVKDARGFVCIEPLPVSKDWITKGLLGAGVNRI